MRQGKSEEPALANSTFVSDIRPCSSRSEFLPRLLNKLPSQVHLISIRDVEYLLAFGFHNFDIKISCSLRENGKNWPNKVRLGQYEQWRRNASPEDDLQCSEPSHFLVDYFVMLRECKHNLNLRGTVFNEAICHNVTTINFMSSSILTYSRDLIGIDVMRIIRK